MVEHLYKLVYMIISCQTVSFVTFCLVLFKNNDKFTQSSQFNFEL